MQLEIRKTIFDVLNMKTSILQKLSDLEILDRSISNELEDFRIYAPYRIDSRYGNHCGKNREVKWIDQNCWKYLVNLYHLEKYMLCTEYEKMLKDLENLNFPEFNEGNAMAWLENLQGLIKENVKILLTRVYENIISSHYYTGSGSYNRQHKKKRNNNGIDTNFIITTNDYAKYTYWRDYPTITDDLEKICYILDGKKLPDITIKNKMRSDRVLEAQNDYFKIKICKNGNTHYTIFEDTLNKLNSYCADYNKIGENIKIKVFD